MNLVLALLRLANIIHNHVADFLHAVLFLRKVLSEGGRADFGQMLMLCNCENLRLLGTSSRLSKFAAMSICENRLP